MKRADRNPQGPKPVIRVEVSEKNRKRRIILAVVCLVFGVLAIMYALINALNTDPGWKTVEVNSSQLNCSKDFVFMYYLGDSGMSATAEYKQLEAVYTEATVNAYRIFNEDIQKLGSHPNQALTVDPGLYRALELVHRYGNRCLYLAPVYVEYDRIFLSENEIEAASYDPGQNPELVEYIRQVSAFANDPGMIDLELLGGNQVRLKVADAYLTFAQENEIAQYLDFGWMKNAFVADYLAEAMSAKGFTRGYLASYDGFTRNLDTTGSTYSFNLFDRQGADIYLPAVMNYNGPCSMVYLRNYPMGDQDRWHYYSFTNGRIVTTCIDPADGMSKSSTDNIVAYGEKSGCAEILLQLIPVYLTEEFSADGLNALTAKGIHSIWFEDAVLRYNDSGLKLTMKTEAAPQYSASYAGK